MRYRARGTRKPGGRGWGPALFDAELTAPAARSLAELPAGSHALVQRLCGGRGLAGRLAGMGLTVGCRIEVLQNRRRGPVLVRVRETRIALGHGEAAKILVEKVHP